MRDRLRNCFCLALALPFMMLTTAVQSEPTADIKTRVLSTHASARGELGLPPLQWDARLAADARQWAQHLAQINALQHWGERGEPDNGEGENLWMGTRGFYSVEQMVGSWASEKAAFRRVRRWEDDFIHVGHYTQMIWRNTTSVGCAIASNAQSDVLVCRYAPQGNFMEQSAY